MKVVHLEEQEAHALLAALRAAADVCTAVGVLANDDSRSWPMNDDHAPYRIAAGIKFLEMELGEEA